MVYTVRYIYIYIHHQNIVNLGMVDPFALLTLQSLFSAQAEVLLASLSCSVGRTRITSFQMLLASYRWDLELRCLAEVAVFPRGKTLRQTRELLVNRRLLTYLPSQTWQMWDGKSRTGHVFPKSFGFHC